MPARTQYLRTSLLALLFALTGCNPTELPDEQEPAAPPAIPSMASLQSDAESGQPQRVAAALSHLGRAADLPPDTNPERTTHQQLLATTFVHTWLQLETLEALQTGEQDAAAFEAREVVIQEWRDALGIVIYGSQPLGVQQGDRSEFHWVASRLRSYLRPMLRDPELRAQAKGLLDLLDAAQFESDSGGVRAAEILASDAQTRPFASNLVLAARAYRTLVALQRLDPVDHASALAAAVGQICPEGILALATPLGPNSVMDAWRHRCGFACGSTAPLGGDAPIQMAPIPDDIYRACPAGQFGLPADVRGAYLALDNHLAIAALTELQRITSVLQDDADDPARASAALFLERFEAQVSDLVVVGQLPFVSATGHDGLRLPAQFRAQRVVAATPAIAVVRNGRLSLAAWPRFQLQNKSVVPVGDEPFGYPGAIESGVAVAEGTDDRSVATLSADLAQIQALPWPQATTQTQGITLVIDASAPAQDLRNAVAILDRLGFEDAQIATWPSGHNTQLPRPTASSITIQVGRADPYTPSIDLADSNTALVDTLGRRTPIPMFAVRRFLPDIYAAILDYARSNPAIRNLVIDPDDNLDVETVVLLIDSLRFARSGDFMASTEALLDAEPYDGPAGAIPVMSSLYIAHD